MALAVCEGIYIYILEYMIIFTRLIYILCVCVCFVPSRVILGQ
jgi:hypothetical protein